MTPTCSLDWRTTDNVAGNRGDNATAVFQVVGVKPKPVGRLKGCHNSVQRVLDGTAKMIKPRPEERGSGGEPPYAALCAVPAG